MNPSHVLINSLQTPKTSAAQCCLLIHDAHPLYRYPHVNTLRVNVLDTEVFG